MTVKDVDQLSPAAVLDALDQWFAHPDRTYEDACALWAVLSALRGPDADAPNVGDVKDGTTVVIRRAAFPLCADLAPRWGRLHPAEMHAISGFGHTPITDLPTVAGLCGQHFCDHVQWALMHLKALGRLPKETSCETKG